MHVCKDAATGWNTDLAGDTVTQSDARDSRDEILDNRFYKIEISNKR